MVEQIVRYLIVGNIMSFLSMGFDKWQAKRGGRRLSERDLFAFAIVAGGFGSIAGMQIFRHKTKHMTFIIGMPAILLAQMGIIAYLFTRV
jgi:Predicted membrane protein